MTEPTVEHATQLLTDPKNQAMARPVGGMVQMRPPATIGALEAMGADHDTARTLIREAAERLGGELRVEVYRSQSAGGGRWGGSHPQDTVWVPVSALRE